MELDFVLSQALGYRTNFSEKVRGLKSAASALEKGDLARAMLVTQFMWLPALADDRACHKAAAADSLVKAGFNPAEPRDGRGRWSTDGSSNHALDSNSDPNFIPVSGILIEPVIPWLEQILPADPPAPIPPFPGEILPPPALDAPDTAIPQSLPRTLDNPYPDDPGCAREWANATKYCRRLADAGQLGIGDYREHGKYYEQCVRGQVSERCGGSPINRGPRKPKGRRWYQ